MKPEVTHFVRAYEQDGQKAGHAVGKDEIGITVQSHWNHRHAVVLTGHDGHSITVIAEDLERAIKNALNVRRI